ncbi:hypothetical protein CBER1_10955 [Cercospora berteroae]|uniref:Peptidase M14 domain-containing protein n=1 Tax=Cercospora berteroae TaxID=357750 RepID=A0A2S6BZ68_9PEZI|nr:hypothetical protein CBER1_10955 [Cercospora berteroae]
MAYKLLPSLLAIFDHSQATRYGGNHASVRKDEPQVEANFPDPGVKLFSPAFLDEKTVQLGFKNGTAGPTSDEALTDFLSLLDERNDWFHWQPADYLSEEGRSIDFVYVSQDPHPHTSADRARIWTQGGVHGDEPAGDQAVFALLGNMDSNKTWTTSILEKVDLLLLPRYNPDGEAKFDPHVAVDLHESSARLQLLSHGEVYIPQTDARFSAAKNLNIHPDIRALSEELYAPAIASNLEANGLRWEPYAAIGPGRKPNETISFVEAESDAKIGRNAMGLIQAVSFLFETRGIGIADQEFARRTYSGLTMLESIVQTTADHASEVLETITKSVEDFVQSEEHIVLTDHAVKTQRNWTFIELDSGDLTEVLIDFSSTTPTQANLTRPRPEAYLIPRPWAELAENLRISGLDVETLSDAYHGTVEALTIERSKFVEPITYCEGAIPVRVTTNSTMKEISLPKGSFRVSTRQKNAALAFAALKPEVIDSFVSCNVIPLEEGDEYPIFREF